MIASTEQIAGSHVTLATIETLTKTFATAHDDLSKTVSELEDEVAFLKRKYLPVIRRKIGTAAQAKLTLHSAIEAAPHLFTQPRTQIFFGVKVGFQKSKGGLDWADADKTLALIRKTFGDDAGAYIRTTEAPDKKMLADLPAADLKKLAITILDTGDVVVIRPTDSELEKTVAALLKDAAETEVAA